MTDYPLAPHNDTLTAITDDKFKSMLADNLEIALSSLNSKNRGEYQNTFRQWSEHVSLLGLDPYFFELMRVRDWLINNEWSFNTRKVKLAHIRKFAEILAHSDNDNQYGFAFNHGRLSLLKPKSLGGRKSVIKHRALTHKQVYTIFDNIIGDSNADTRNRAILGLMLLSGLRASELVSLKWENVDIKGKLIFVYEGKGGKSAHIPMLGDLPILLNQWKLKQNVTRTFEHVVCVVHRSDLLGNDKKCTARVINSLTNKISNLTGIQFNPHDARRTAITALLSSGATVPEVRDFSRHSSGETTLRYAQKSTASTLGRKLHGKLKYGDVLGAPNHSDDGRYYECINGHGFTALEPDMCPKCGSEELSHQDSMFDD